MTKPREPAYVPPPARSNTVLSGSTFEEANLKDTDWSDSYLGDFDQRKICKNPTLGGENPTTGNPSRESAGCGGR